MPALKLEKFGGMLPAWDDTLLPQNQAVYSRNTYLYTGAQNGWREPKLMRALTDSTARAAFRIPNTADKTLHAPSTWLEFADHETDVMKSEVADDVWKRYYFASPSQSPKYNTFDRIQLGLPPWFLGVPAPNCAPGVTAEVGGNADIIGPKDPTSLATVTIAQNHVYLNKVTPTGSMQLDSISIVPNETNVVATFKGVVYADANGVPGRLIATGLEVHLVTTIDAPLTSSFIVPPGLDTGLSYWIGVVTGTQVQYQTDSGQSIGYTAPMPYTNPPLLDAPIAPVGQSTPRMWGTVTSSAVMESRAYVYTYVTDYGEESQPSPPTLHDAWTNSVWTITLFSPPAADMGTDRNIKKTRLYRTISGSTGNTTYFLVAEFDCTQEAYVDTITDEIVAANTQLQSTLWSPPPSDMQGILAMPNGMAVGWRKNEIWFCEPYRPHAWPSTYVLTTEYDIVGLGVVGQAVVACTESAPAIAAGVNPASMSLTKVKMPEPCTSRGSILSTDLGVYYASPNGLVFVDQYGKASNATEQWITRENWQALTSQKNLHAIKMVSSYFAFGVVRDDDHSEARRGFTVEMGADAQSFTILPQPGGHRLGFSLLDVPGTTDLYNIFVDPWTGVGMLIQNGNVYYYDFTDQAPVVTPYVWRSKKFQQQTKKNFEVMRVWFTVPPGSPALNPKRYELPHDQMVLQPDMYGIVRVYADGRLVTARELRTSGELLRIDSGFKSEFWQWEIEARVIVSTLQTATSVREMAGV